MSIKCGVTGAEAAVYELPEYKGETKPVLALQMITISRTDVPIKLQQLNKRAPITLKQGNKLTDFPLKRRTKNEPHC